MRIHSIGHRGASEYSPEKALESYLLAIQMGVDFVGTDIHMLRDDTLLAIHDADLKRTTNGKAWLVDLITELKLLDAVSCNQIVSMNHCHSWDSAVKLACTKGASIEADILPDISIRKEDRK